jgi:ABC-type bacteriocin/lantibiotic exporter with double-glycine peptidase domain
MPIDYLSNNISDTMSSSSEYALGRKRRRRIFRTRKPQIVMQQRETDCGAACFASVLKFYGVKKVNLSAIHELLRSGRDGTNFEQLGESFDEIGIESRPVETNLSLLQERYEKTLDEYKPIVLHWRGNHFVVLYQLSKKGALIADPAAGLYTISYGEFSEKWTGYALLLERTDIFSPENLDFTSPNAWHKFYPFLKRSRKTFAAVFVLAIFLQLLALVQPIGMKYLFDNLINAKEYKFVDLIIGGLLLALLVDALFQFIRGFVLTRVEQRLNLSMKSVFYEHLFKLPVSYFNRQRVGDLLTLNSDTGTIGQLLAGRTLVVALDLLTFITYLIVLCYLQFKLLVVAVCLIPLYAGAVSISAKFLQKLYRLNFAKAAELQSYTAEHLGGLTTIKALAIEDQVAGKMRKLILSLQDNQIKTAKISLISSGVNSFFMIGGQTLVFWYGVHLVINGDLSIGSLVAFIAVLSGLLRPAGSLVSLWNDIQQVRLASERLGTFFASKPEYGFQTQEDNKSNASPPEIVLRNVSYRYHGASKFDAPALNDVSFTFEAGKIYGVVGPSGSGKSTLAQLLVKFDNPTEGKIYYDGKESSFINPNILRQNIGYMSQDVYLFNCSIRENISYGNSNLTEQEVLEAAEIVGATEFIRSMPRGFETILSERGMGLSGGQRQRIALARMICRKPRLLILDEVTSSLDLKSEETIYSNLLPYFRERTVIIISHRPETLKYADQIIEIENGKINSFPKMSAMA